MNAFRIFFFLSHHALSLKAHLDCVLFKIILFYDFICIFICDCAGSSLLCAGFLQVWRGGLLFVAVHGLLIAVASLVAERMLQVCGLQ